MRTPGTPRILLFTTFAVVLAIASAVGQMDWMKLSPASSPPVLSGPAMAYDEARLRVVLYGGSGSSTIYNDTWEWDGRTWVRKKPTSSPPMRGNHAMAYDAARRRVVLFGGWGTKAQRSVNDTWEWDGSNWKNVTPSTGNPPGRRWHTMAYDAARKRVVLFGGYGNNAPYYLNDTWEWDGATWRQENPRIAPPTRAEHAMAYDAARKRTVMFSGADWRIFHDTWEWDGNDWKDVTLPSGNPVGRMEHSMAYDAARQRVVLFGGSISYSLREVWEWDGKSWTHRTAPTNIVQRHFGTAYDSARGAIVIFGGTTPWTNDTWVYAPTDLTARAHVVSVATGGNVSLNLDAGTRHAGKFYLVSGCMDSGGPRGIPSLPVKLLLNPDGYFWFNLVFPNTLIQNSLRQLDALGKATATVQLPPLPLVPIGTRFYHAYVVFDSTGILYTSAPVPLTFVP